MASFASSATTGGARKLPGPKQWSASLPSATSRKNAWKSVFFCKKYKYAREKGLVQDPRPNTGRAEKMRVYSRKLPEPKQWSASLPFAIKGGARKPPGPKSPFLPCDLLITEAYNGLHIHCWIKIFKNAVNESEHVLGILFLFQLLVVSYSKGRKSCTIISS